MLTRELCEHVGEGHDRATLLEARRRTQAAVREIARQLAPGMIEAEGLEITRSTLRAHGLDEHWVEPYLRFGTNTLGKYGAPSDPGVALGRNDVWFIDVGPLWRGHECDVADTFAIGDDAELHRIVRDVHEIFDRTRRHWLDARATGDELYHHAATQAESLGWQLDREMCGHRLSKYPHAPHYDGSLAAFPFTPSGGLWMLEIQIRHPDKPYSAFFEDLLLDESDY